MSKYSIELRTLVEDLQFKLFDFDYPFYVDNEVEKKRFEDMFTNHYFFNEIGCETVVRWKHMLASRLNTNADMYKQLYITELRGKDIDYLYNKDYKETFTKDVNRNDNIIDDTTNTLTSTTEGGSVESALNNGIANVNVDTSKTSQGKANSSNNTTNTTGNKKIGIGSEAENYTLIGKGNIGTTSSADLLTKWRESLINLNKIIIEDCRDLFMQIY